MDDWRKGGSMNQQMLAAVVIASSLCIRQAQTRIRAICAAKFGAACENGDVRRMEVAMNVYMNQHASCGFLTIGWDSAQRTEPVTRAVPRCDPARILSQFDVLFKSRPLEWGQPLAA